MKDKGLLILAILSVVKFLIHLIFSSNYGIFRDELLYIELGKHLDWGYWSNPPSIGFFSWITQHFIGLEVRQVRLIPALLGGGLVMITGLMVRAIGGGIYSQVIAGMAILLSPAYLRVPLLFSPVVFDVVYWSIGTYLLIKYLFQPNPKLIIWFGVLAGLGFLNKYSVGLLLMSTIFGLLLTEHRKVLVQKETFIALGLFLLIITPNLFWQWKYAFPVFTHMRILAETQLVNVNRIEFIMDQVLMNVTSLLVWLPGIYFLLIDRRGKPWRAAGWTFAFTIVFLLISRGKSYYTLGIYPMVIAFGAYYLALITENWSVRAIRLVPMAFMVIIIIPLLPICVTFLSVEKEQEYCSWLANEIGIDGPLRWEDGQIHHLPQDFADMFGWDELAELAHLAYEKAEDKKHCILYGEDYPHVGAVGMYSYKYDFPEYFSMSDSYRLWLKDTISSDVNTFIYINDELGEDIDSIFASITKIGQIKNPYARDRGVTVYLCEQPRSPFSDHYKNVVSEFKKRYNLFPKK